MAQADYNIAASPSGLNMRTEINQIFDSILTHNSGSTAPTVTKAFMMWVDTSNATYYYLKMRNHDNTAWVILGTYTVATKTYTSYADDDVKLTGNQTIDGVKTFTSNILVPNISYKSTPVSITSWSYATTTITLNVASHTFIAGDYIEVSGLTSTTYPANGIQLVISVTSTTIVFASSATPTGTAGVSSATVKGYATTNGKVSESIGINQTWQDVTSSRSSGVTYTNTTGKPIFIFIKGITGTGSNISLTINGIAIGIFSTAGTGVLIDLPLPFVIPNGATYSCTSAPGATINKWLELR